LAFTGGRSSDFALLAAVLLACGLGMVVVVRRRRGQRGA
jgi:LPXTG-motif cell wall-anchored protein